MAHREGPPAGLVDTVEAGVIPLLLGAVIPLLPLPASRIGLSLTAHHMYRSGIVSLKYAIGRMRQWEKSRAASVALDRPGKLER